MKTKNLIALAAIAVVTLCTACNDEDLTPYYNELCAYTSVNYTVGEQVKFVNNTTQEVATFTVDESNGEMVFSNFKDFAKLDTRSYGATEIKMTCAENNMTLWVLVALAYIDDWGVIIFAGDKDKEYEKTTTSPMPDITADTRTYTNNCNMQVTVQKGKGIIAFVDGDGGNWKLQE